MSAASHVRRAGALLLGALLLWSSPPAAVAAQEPVPERQAQSTAAEPATAPFTADAELEAAGRRIARRHTLAADRVDAILDLIFDNEKRGGLDFQYAWRPSRSAVEAYRARSGNCLSLVNLFVALARSAGLSAGFVEVLDFEAFYREEASIVRSTHVIGGVHVDGELATVDFFPGRPKTYRRTRAISDRRAAAHFYNSKAVEAMQTADPVAAEALFEVALEVDPEHAETWNNRAVLRLRQGETEVAIDYLERALALDPDLVSAMENLVPLYRRAGRAADAERVERLAFDRRTGNPFFLLQKALAELAAGDLDEARKLLRRARRIDPSVPEIHLALGRLELRADRERKAAAHFEAARETSAAFSETFQGRIQSKIDLLLGAPGPEPSSGGVG